MSSLEGEDASAVPPVEQHLNLSHRNLFTSLFEFRPRKDHSPRENFLTEAFAYLLETDQAVRDAWLSELAETTIGGATCNIETRASEVHPEKEVWRYPDLVIEALCDGKRFGYCCEHKWDSCCDLEQLRDYQAIAQQKNAKLVFIGARVKDKKDAESCFPSNPCKSFLWEQVFVTLDSIAEKSNLLAEFLDFMRTHGLSPGRPITTESMKALVEATYFVPMLEHMAQKLWANYSWEVVPERFRKSPQVKNNYGRVAILLSAAYKPSLTLGFYYDDYDHRVPLTDPQRGIDLLLRIEAAPGDTKNIDQVFEVLEKKQRQLGASSRRTRALLKGEAGNKNPYTLFIVLECLADVIDGKTTESEQLAAIHDRLTAWLTILFQDGILEMAFRADGLNFGMT